MSAAEVVSRHLIEDRHLLASLTREEKRGGPLVIFITGARYRHRLLSALALANVRIEARQREADREYGVLDANLAKLARGIAK